MGDALRLPPIKMHDTQMLRITRANLLVKGISSDEADRRALFVIRYGRIQKRGIRLGPLTVAYKGRHNKLPLILRNKQTHVEVPTMSQMAQRAFNRRF